MKNVNAQNDSKVKIKRIKELVQFRKFLMDELSGIDNYQKKVEKVRRHYDNRKT